MNKKIIIMVVVVVVVILSVFAYFRFNEDTWLCQNGQWVKHGQPSSPAPTSGCGNAANQNVNKAAVNTTANTNIQAEQAGPLTSESGNVIVESPLANEAISSPLKISGQARVFENQLNYRLNDGGGSILAQGNMTAGSLEAGQFGQFSVEVNYLKPKSGQGTLEVFDYSAKDGSEADKVTIPVKF
jgi:hypothetical protein